MAVHVTPTAYTGPAARPQYLTANTSDNGKPRRLSPLAYCDHSPEEWKQLVRGRPRAGVLAANSKRAAEVARAVPTGAVPVRLGAVVAGYLAKPARFSTMTHDQRFRMLRWVELARIADHRVRHGIPLDGEAWLRAMASVSSADTLSRWARDIFPEVGPDVVEDAFKGADRERTRFTASELGELIGLTVEERENIDVRTIRPAGMTRRAFADYSRERTLKMDRDRAQTKRRGGGIAARRKGESAKEDAKREGVSVATIYRRRALAKAEAEAVCEAKIRQGDPNRYSGFSPITDRALVPTPSATAPDEVAPDGPQRASIWFVAAFDRSAAPWRIPIVPANSDPGIARLGARVAAHAAAHRRAAQIVATVRRAA